MAASILLAQAVEAGATLDSKGHLLLLLRLLVASAAAAAMKSLHRCPRPLLVSIASSLALPRVSAVTAVFGWQSSAVGCKPLSAAPESAALENRLLSRGILASALELPASLAPAIGRQPDSEDWAEVHRLV